MNSKNFRTALAVIVLGGVGLLTPQPASAASPEVVAAVKTIAEIAADATRFRAYCNVVKEMEAAEDDAAKYNALVQQMEGLLRSFGPQFERVVELAESDLVPTDEQAIEEAFDNLDGRCPD